MKYNVLCKTLDMHESKYRICIEVHKGYVVEWQRIYLKQKH